MAYMINLSGSDIQQGVSPYNKAVLIQHFRFDTDIFVQIVMNKFYPADIIKLTDASFIN